MTDAWQSIKIRRFEHVTAGPATSLLRVDGKPPWRRVTAQRPTLLVDCGGEAQRFAALPSPPDPRGVLRAAYSVPSTLIDPETRFWLEHSDGSLTELPQPTPGASRRDRPVIDTPSPEAAAPPPDIGDVEPPETPETERRADVHAKLAEQSGALADSVRAAVENEQARRLAETELARTRAEAETRVSQARAAGEREVAEARAEAERATADAERARAEARAEAEHEVAQARAEAEQARAEAEQARADADQLLADLETAAQQRIAEAVAQSEALVADADARVAVAETLLSEVQNRVAEAETVAGDAQSRVAEAELHAAEAEARATEAESRATEQEQLTTQAEQRTVQAEQRAVQAEQTAAEGEQRAQTAEAELAAAREHAQELRTRTQELERLTTEQQERVESMDRLLAEKQPEQSALERELQALRSSRASVEQELDQARDQLRMMTFERDELSRQAAAFDAVAIKARERATKAEFGNERLNETIEELQTWRGELERRLAATTSELGVAKAARQADERELKRLRELLTDTGHPGEHGDLHGGESSHTLAAQAAEIELLMAEVASLRAGHDPGSEGSSDPQDAGRIAALEAERAEMARRAAELSAALAQVLEPARLLAELAEAGRDQPSTGAEANFELVSRAAERTAREQAERELRAAARESSTGHTHPG